MLRHAEPVRRRVGEVSRFARLSGARDDERRDGLRGRQGRRRRRPGLCAEPHPRPRPATDLPINADFEAGFARDAEGVHESARLCVGAGVAGFSIEDYTGDRNAPLYGLERSGRATARGARRHQRERREGLAHRAQRGDPARGRRPSRGAAASRRLCGSRRRRALRAVTENAGRSRRGVRVAGKLPVNVLVGAPGFTKRQLEDLGVKRIAPAARCLAPPGAGSCARRKTSPSTGGLTPSPACRR